MGCTADIRFLGSQREVLGTVPFYILKCLRVNIHGNRKHINLWFSIRIWILIYKFNIYVSADY